jgi:signal transduction histidine kinase
MRTKHKVIAISTSIGLAVWIIDAVNDYFFFYKGSFWGLLISDVPAHELYIRPVILGFFILFGVMISRVIVKREQAENALKKAKEELEIKVEDRTGELQAAHDRLELQLLQCKLVEGALRESEEKLRFLSSQLLTAQEEERRRISRELHDELGQALAILKLKMRSVKRDLRADQTAVKDECEQSLQYIDQVIDNVRRLSRNLSPSILEDLGLSAGLKRLVNDFTDCYQVEASLAIGEIDRLFSQKTQIMLYRILQEALTNVGKHAQASQISLGTQMEDGTVTFYVEDDGKGFDVKRTMNSPQKGLGLATMHERVRILGRSLELLSEVGKGTRISFSIPAETKRSE